MKKLLLVGALVIYGIAMAQENSIKANPAALLGGTDLVSFEHKFGDRISGVVGAGYGGFKLGGYKYNSYGGGLQGRYYFDEAMTGFYGALVADYLSGKVEIDENGFNFNFGDTEASGGSKTEINFSGFGGGLRVGYQWIFDSGFTLDLNVGASYRAYNYKWNNSAEEAEYEGSLKGNGILPTGSVGLGYSF
ncbi:MULTISPECIES: DUF3575 domain-containing protein [Chryseobacterium]|uniref:DUF3575 domain-containing protein n=1 Tax=Chryseobacterium camelliae TaxID=1265445 RepID=A0ABU0TH41_9FLAO|nr:MULTISPECIES: DUF3575 domain-containing protein [Chryseobacterium]MDT3405826.1 hypothetical protein [Pseudacidovorax intermedius]MDQ1096368.1 hypothetical protein [Chryseobacterium camelliae]MDQ1100307.1 hypothetical protein [Chryseobacterium sp. SORGH_AS_1048]MDR6087650.1 hypothetical protein [Chryseobacterium sp. SORGH_AS_0909]MDR6132023.1 hypothetical protein [Chryseobacterium sp. SORGH_AS_1175]